MVDLKEKLEKQPVIETRISKSEDGKWILHKTIITDIKSVNYYDKVFEDSKEETADAVKTSTPQKAKA